VKSGASVKRIFTTQMKCAVGSAIVLLALVSGAFPVLRLLFLAKPVAPSNGDLIITGDELVLRSARKPLLHHPARHVPKGKDFSFVEN
jgi:hypothetical protein